MSLLQGLRSLVLAFQFLWRLPIPVRLSVGSEDFRGALCLFPVVGLTEGLIVCGALGLAQPILREPSPNILALLIMVVIFFLRGIFHLDGLVDTFDALSVKEGPDKEKTRLKRLSVMKESTLGVAGATALVLFILGKFSLLSELLGKNLSYAREILLLTLTLSRTFLPVIIFFLKPARNEGLGFLMRNSLDGRVLAKALCLAVVILLSLLLLGLSVGLLSLLLGSQLILVFYLRRLFEKKFAGGTGDTFGFFVEVSEMLSLTLGYVGWGLLF